MLSKQLTIGQAISFFLTIFSVVGSAWIDMRVIVARLETRQSELELRVQETRKTEEEHYKELKNSSQAIYNKLVEIQVQVQNKQDRP